MKALWSNCAELALDKLSVVTGILVKCTVTGRMGVDILAMIAWVSGSSDVFEEGTITPRRMGAGDVE